MEIHTAIATGWEWAAAAVARRLISAALPSVQCGHNLVKKKGSVHKLKKNTCIKIKKAKIITQVMQHSLGQSLHWQWIQTCNEPSWFIQSMKLLCLVSRTKRTLVSVWSFQLQQNICPSFLNIKVTGRKGRIRITTGIVLVTQGGWNNLNH